MADRTKRIFISDIHMGDEKSVTTHFPYGWFNKNAGLLASFLNEQLESDNVKELVVLGDLFDQWIIPTDGKPLTTFEDICNNPVNKPVIEGLKALAQSEVKLAYVPGNHDMPVNGAEIAKIGSFLEKTFPGIRFFCDSQACGVYSVGTIAAEHGNRYGLFNAPDPGTRNGDFLPVGYFISRLVAYKAMKEAQQEDCCNILYNIIKDWTERPNLVQSVLMATAEDAGLSGESSINLDGIPGYPAQMTVAQIGELFRNLPSEWKAAPGNMGIPAAIFCDRGSLVSTAESTYFRPGSHINVVICGHTHIPVLTPNHYGDMSRDDAPDPKETACRNIYANSGAWVDLADEGCTYVEVENDKDRKRLYVRLMKYSGEKEKSVLDEAFVAA